MSNLGLPQLLLIALIAGLIFGATRLSEIRRGVAQLRRAKSVAQDRPKLGDQPTGASESRRHRSLAA